MRWLGLIWLCLPLSLAGSGRRVPGSAGGPVGLRCEPRGFRLTVSSSVAAAPRGVTAWDKSGRAHGLRNDSACGVWVTAGPEGSVVLEAAYDGCLVIPWGSYYTLLVGVGPGVAAPTEARGRKVFRCPMGVSVPQAPDASVCESVAARDRLPCGPPDAPREACEELGCCYSSKEGGGACYYGNRVTAHCSREGGFSVAVSRTAAWPPLRADSVRLGARHASGCRPALATRAFVLFRFPFTACGTTGRVTGDRAVYENELAATRDVSAWDRGSVTRDGDFRLRIRCSYSVNSRQLPVDIQVYTVAPPPPPKVQPGPLSLELRIAKDESYGSYYSAGDYPVVRSLRDPVYVEVSLLHRTDPRLGLLLRRCWATPSPDPRDGQRWPILVRGCPYAGDNYETRPIPVLDAAFPAHAQRFRISAFSFIDSTRAGKALGGQVYLHCSAAVCQPVGTPSCVAACPVSRRRGRSSLHFENNTASISSKGPMLLLQAAAKDPSEELDKYFSPPADSSALWVAGISGSLIITGTLFVSYLALRKQRSYCDQTRHAQFVFTAIRNPGCYPGIAVKPRWRLLGFHRLQRRKLTIGEQARNGDSSPGSREVLPLLCGGFRSAWTPASHTESPHRPRASHPQEEKQDPTAAPAALYGEGHRIP
ncbi:zona pellucida sperm-binding protein 4 [Perognathus longimembris pacificus]|uniref:zona pellucida sperm-binding protein 4 n=1 Tax=Perognathus longimembris pacificus TaxID=214514 RepID=UPI0020188FF4|nr:zona pellucida sperm-binding protein 4 [Perognathus longimembris pacificus]